MRKLAIPLLLAAALAACSDSPVQPAVDGDEPRVVAVYDESEFAAAGLKAPSVDDIMGRAGTTRVNAVSRLGGGSMGPSYDRYSCEDREITRYPDYYPDNPCYEEPDCYSNPYAPGCGDPCVWNPNLPECGGLVIDFDFGSDATGPVWVNRGGTLLKEVTLTSWSQAGANAAFATLDVSFRNVGAQSGSACNNASQEFDSSHSSGSGNPLTLQDTRVANYLGTVKWEVWGTHGFTPVSGASGGGTFYSSDFVCG